MSRTVKKTLYKETINCHSLEANYLRILIILVVFMAIKKKIEVLLTDPVYFSLCCILLFSFSASVSLSLCHCLSLPVSIPGSFDIHCFLLSHYLSFSISLLSTSLSFFYFLSLYTHTYIYLPVGSH